jgi:hypothetical protein
MGVSAGRPFWRRSTPQTSLLLLIAAATFIYIGCGSSTTRKASDIIPTTPPPPQPNYPSIPAEQISWSPSKFPTIPAPPAEDETTAPWKNGANDFPLSVWDPLTNTTVTSPINVVAAAKPKNPIFFMRVYVDQLAVYYTFNDSINTQIFASSGTHTVTVLAEDKQGYISATVLQVTVSGQAPTTNGQTTISNIQAMPGWQSCSALFPTGSGRDGQICAAGLGTAQSTMTENQSNPSMDGNSAKFTMGGPTAYTNMLYFNPIAGGNNVTHFIYDLYFYIDNPNAAQALEFDINQTFGGKRWVWGSECSFNASKKWDIWDDINGWVPTVYDCKPFPANTWIHLVWNVERVGDQVHYISLTVGDQTFPVDTYFSNQPNWTLEEIDVAFQMDGNYRQEPYNVWLDEVKLTAY